MVKISKQNKAAIGFACLLLLPAVLHFCIFYIYINSQSFLLAVKDDNGFTWEYMRMVFRQFSTSGSEITLALKNTMIFFIVGNFVMFPLALLFSYLLYKKLAGYKYFRIVFFMPSIISAVVMVTLYKNIVNGPISEIWMKITGTNYMPLFLDSSEYALKFILLYEFWLGIAGNMIIYSGTMNRIPMEVIESENRRDRILGRTFLYGHSAYMADNFHHVAFKLCQYIRRVRTYTPVYARGL